MKPWQRAAITAGAVFLVIALALAVHSLIAFGAFTSVAPRFAGTCTKIGPLEGPEDIAIDGPSGLAFISAMDRRVRASKADGLYVLSLKGPARPTRLSGAPADFHPHGISLYRDAQGLALFAINHRSDGTNSVEIFDVSIENGTAALHQTGSIESRVLSSPNAIVAADRARFYVANDHGSTTKLGRWLDDVLVLPRADILFFNGMVFRTVAEHLAYPSGLALSPDGALLYATETYARRIDTFRVQPFIGTLTAAGTLDIPAGADNLRFDDAGNLWVAGHPKALASPAPSEVFEVTLANGIPQAATPVYANDGSQIAYSSVAAVLGNRMLIGSPRDDHILDCRL